MEEEVLTCQGEHGGCLSVCEALMSVPGTPPELLSAESSRFAISISPVGGLRSYSRMLQCFRFAISISPEDKIIQMSVAVQTAEDKIPCNR